jgi:hypothetical protein
MQQERVDSSRLTVFEAAGLRERLYLCEVVFVACGTAPYACCDVLCDQSRASLLFHSERTSEGAASARTACTTGTCASAATAAASTAAVAAATACAGARSRRE